MRTTYSDTAELLQLVQMDAVLASAGSCAFHSDPNLWHRDDRSDPDFCQSCTDTAVTICQTCPIQSWCDARSAGETSGVWAGRPRSASVDGRRNATGHTCEDGRKIRDAARKREERARRGLIPRQQSATG